MQEQDICESDDVGIRSTVNKYMAAFEAADVAALVALLTDDVVLEVPLWLIGPDNYRQFMTRVFGMRGTDWKTPMVAANERPAIAAYCRHREREYRLHSLQIFTVAHRRISASIAFQNSDALDAFALPKSWVDR